MDRTHRIVRAAVTAIAVLAGAVPPAIAQEPSLAFGLDAGNLHRHPDLGLSSVYAQVWAGAWSHPHGWDAIREQVDAVADGGAQPVVEWFYWGNDISPACVQSGCQAGSRTKSSAEWDTAAAALADAVHQGLAGRAGIIVIETEFNKQGIAGWEDFDRRLADHARKIRDRAPEALLALGFGNWGNESWANFDRAMHAVDLAGLQTMRGATRNDAASYLATPQRLEDGVRKLHDLFGKPIIVHDLALSSYGGFEHEQEAALREILASVDQLQALGLQGITYRALRDHPGADTSDYFGAAEGHFGLQYADGRWKPALDEWIEGARTPADGPPPLGPPSDLMSTGRAP